MSPVKRKIKFRFRQSGPRKSADSSIKLSVASFRTARFDDGHEKPGRGIWLFVWRVFKLELTEEEPVQREPRPQLQGPWTRSVETHVELLDGGSATLVGGDDLHLHDLDGVGASAVASSHVTIWQETNKYNFIDTVMDDRSSSPLRFNIHA